MNTPNPEKSPISIPFTQVQHTITIPVLLVGSIHSRFIIDTGIGGNLISRSLFEKIGCKLTGKEFKGKRMSGQEVTAPLTSIPSVSLSSFKLENVPAGVFDLSLPPDFAGIEGFLSLDFFAQDPFTIDYASRSLVIETEASLLSRLKQGVEVGVRIEKEAPAIEAFLRLDLSNGRTIEVEVDMGSDELVLNSEWVRQLGISEESKGVRKFEGENETGDHIVRYFSELVGKVALTENPSIYQSNPKVMFQKIIYDGLVGQSFLKNFTVTYDIPHSRMIFAKPEE